MLEIIKAIWRAVKMNSVSVKYGNLDLEVVGQWVKPVREHRAADPADCEPAEPGYFEDYSILLGKIDITEVLSLEATMGIMEKAVEAML